MLRDRTVSVPLDHDAPDGEHIDVFVRAVTSAERTDRELPWLLYLQGGPGGPADRPSDCSGWIATALQTHRVLLLDQRGTGRSTPVTPQRLAARGGVAAQADYLALHRADAIVRDAEAVRQALLGPDARWSLLGQSYGGFCAFSYLTLAPEHLDAVHMTGGVPPVGVAADDIYRATYPRVLAKNAAYARAFPADRAKLDWLVGCIRGPGVTLPDGSPLTVRRLQTLGLALGLRRRCADLHWLLDDVLPGEPPSPALLAGLQAALSFASRPLFVLLHEPIYSDGPPTRWAAERVRAEHAAFDDGADEVLLTGEMVYPWMLEDDPSLRPYREVAHALAERAGWSRLYDPAVLSANTVPVAAAVYAEDMYVDRDLSLAAAAGVGAMRTWLTDAFEHDGLRESPAVLERLLRMTQYAV